MCLVQKNRHPDKSGCLVSLTLFAFSVKRSAALPSSSVPLPASSARESVSEVAPVLLLQAVEYAAVDAQRLETLAAAERADSVSVLDDWLPDEPGGYPAGPQVVHCAPVAPLDDSLWASLLRWPVRWIRTVILGLRCWTIISLRRWSGTARLRTTVLARGFCWTISLAGELRLADDSVAFGRLFSGCAAGRFVSAGGGGRFGSGRFGWGRLLSGRLGSGRSGRLLSGRFGCGCAGLFTWGAPIRLPHSSR